MKITKLPFLFLALILGLASCSDNDDEVLIIANLSQAQLSYSADGVWSEVAANQDFTINYLHFNHVGEMTPWGLSWEGFTPARCDNDDYNPLEVSNWVDHQFEVTAGGGIGGQGTPYIVAYWNTQENETTPAENRSCRVTYRKDANSPALPFRPQSVYVSMTDYVLWTLTKGNDFCRPMKDGDWFKVIAHGVKADGSETATSFYFAGEDPQKLSFKFGWQKFDLTSLGEVTELYFTLASSDTGQWGMNSPSFFAMDRLTISAKLPE